MQNNNLRLTMSNLLISGISISMTYLGTKYAKLDNLFYFIGIIIFVVFVSDYIETKKEVGAAKEIKVRNSELSAEIRDLKADLAKEINELRKYERKFFENEVRLNLMQENGPLLKGRASDTNKNQAGTITKNDSSI